MLDKKLDHISLDDLNDLIVNQVRESKTLEYKRELPKGDDNGVKKFLAGVSALANTSGGDFLIGISADDGVPVTMPGVLLESPDQEELRLVNWLRDGLEPRLPRCDIRSIPVDDAGNHVIIVRVPQSGNAPHRVIHRGHDKFYGRNTAGKYPLDVFELRTAFTLSEQISERIRNFRIERIAALYGDEGPVSLPDDGKLLLHIIPLAAFTGHNALDITACYNDQHFPFPLGGAPDDRFVTLDGVVSVANQGDHKPYKYVLAFRTGILEAVYTFLPSHDDKAISAIGYERDLIQALPGYLKFLAKHNLNPPFYLFVTLIGVKGYWFRSSRLSNTQPLTRDLIQLPEIVLETPDAAPHTILKPAFDMIWNAFGGLKSYNYDDAGNWIGVESAV
jgi:hypothetical protein